MVVDELDTPTAIPSMNSLVPRDAPCGEIARGSVDYDGKLDACSVTAIRLDDIDVEIDGLLKSTNENCDPTKRSPRPTSGSTSLLTLPSQASTSNTPSSDSLSLSPSSRPASSPADSSICNDADFADDETCSINSPLLHGDESRANDDNSLAFHGNESPLHSVSPPQLNGDSLPHLNGDSPPHLDDDSLPHLDDDSPPHLDDDSPPHLNGDSLPHLDDDSLPHLNGDSPPHPDGDSPPYKNNNNSLPYQNNKDDETASDGDIDFAAEISAMKEKRRVAKLSSEIGVCTSNYGDPEMNCGEVKSYRNASTSVNDTNDDLFRLTDEMQEFIEERLVSIHVLMIQLKFVYNTFV